jgi:HK97 family phage portal protein
VRLIDRFRSDADTEQRAMANPWGEWPGESAGPTWSGKSVTSTSSLQLLTVYGCVRFIAEGVATLPLDTFSASGDESIPRANPVWIEEPTADLDRVSWLTQILASLLLDGNAYLLRGYKDTSLRTLTPIDPTKVTVQRERSRKSYIVDGKPVNPFDILHIPAIMLPGSDVGMSPIEAARQSIGVGLASQEYAARFFGQGATLSGVIETPNALDADGARKMAQAWHRAHSGTSKAHLPGVLEGGATWKPTSITNEQAQFLESRGYTAAEIAAQMFLIDPTEFGLQGGSGSSITYANLEQRNARKVQVTFLPWIVRLERAFSAELAAPRFVKFNVDALIRGDTKTQAEAFAIATANQAWMAPSEVRSKLDLPPKAGIDDKPEPVPQPEGVPT